MATAASITITQAQDSINSTPKRLNVKTNSAIVYCQGAATLTKKTDETEPSPTAVSSNSQYGTASWTTYQYSDNLTFNWSIGQKTGTGQTCSIEVKNLNSKSIVTITGTLTVQTQETPITHTNNYSRSWVLPSEGEPKREDYSNDTDYNNAYQIWYAGGNWGDWHFSGSEPDNPGTATTITATTNVTTDGTHNLVVYTRPGAFSEYGFSVDTIIESSDGLTAEKVSHWVAHCNTAAHWYNQNSLDTANSCAVSTGDYITATWYNSCVDAMPCGKPSKVIANVSIITADVINVLGTGISIDDSWTEPSS